MVNKDNFDIKKIIEEQRRDSLKLLSLIYDVNKEPMIKKMAAELISDIISGRIDPNDMEIERHYHLDVFNQEGTLLRSANYLSKEQANAVARVAMGSDAHARRTPITPYPPRSPDEPHPPSPQNYG